MWNNFAVWCHPNICILMPKSSHCTASSKCIVRADFRLSYWHRESLASCASPRMLEPIYWDMYPCYKLRQPWEARLTWSPGCISQWQCAWITNKVSVIIAKVTLTKRARRINYSRCKTQTPQSVNGHTKYWSVARNLLLCPRWIFFIAYKSIFWHLYWASYLTFAHLC